MRAALFATCIGDLVFPPGQACCGQMHVNIGYFPEAMPIVRNHVATFEPVLDGEWDAIVVPSGSCTGSIRHQQAMVAEGDGVHGPRTLRVIIVTDR